VLLEEEVDRGSYQPAALESVLDSTNGVSIHGFVFGVGRAMDPMVAGFVSLAGAHFASPGFDVDMRGSCTVWSLEIFECVRR